MRFRRFVLLDGTGDLLWATTFVGLGWLAGEPFFRVLALVMGYAGSAAGFLAGWISFFAISQVRTYML